MNEYTQRLEDCGFDREYIACLLFLFRHEGREAEIEDFIKRCEMFYDDRREYVD